MSKKNEDRVLIAGAGPSGMVAACFLAQQGIPVTVFEAQAELPTDLRASTFHPATLDQLDVFPGVTKELIDWGLIAPTWQFRDRETGPVVTWDLSVLKGDTNHPYRVQSEQWKLTRILARRLEAFPHAELRYRHEAVSAANEADAVALTVKTPDGIAIERGRYLIGADGANSAVRRSNDVPFDGVTFPELYFTLSTRFPFEKHLPNLTYVNYISDPGEWVVLLRVSENWRVLLPSRPGEPRDEILQEDSVQSRLNGIVRADTPYETVHRTLYHVHERVAERYRIGRIFLAGDAAHINNPLGGMGMNGGIQDGFNIAEKLAMVWRREADDAMLDRYDRQRRWSALDFVQKNAVRNRENLRQSDPAERARTHEAMRRTAADPKAAREFLMRTSMIQALRDCAAIA